MTQLVMEFGGKNLRFPSEEGCRRYLLECAEHFSELTGLPLYEIGQRSMNDPAFFPDIAAGRNFKIRTFETVMLWLDTHWPMVEAAE
jgi:hypothetical protein